MNKLLKTLTAVCRFSGIYGKECEKHALESACWELTRKWMQESTSPALTLFRPQVIYSSTDKPEYQEHMAKCIGVEVAFELPTETKMLDMDAICTLCEAFYHNHRTRPTHLLLPPGYRTTLDGPWVRETRTLTMPTLSHRTDFTFLDLKIIPNAPMLAVAVL